MADFNSSLPVRTQNNGDVVVNIADGTTETQKLAIDASGKISDKLNDGSGNPITSQVNGSQRALDVGIDVAGVQIDPRQIRTLTSTDVVTVDQGTTPWVDNLIQVGGSAISLGQKTSANSFPVVIASDQSTIPVTVITSSPGTAVQSYMTSAALAAGSSATLTYTVAAGHTFNLLRVFASASGKIKVIVQNGATTMFAAFNSTAQPNIDITVAAPPTIAAAGTVNVIITNDDLQAFDVYATVEGNQN